MVARVGYLQHAGLQSSGQSGFYHGAAVLAGKTRQLAMPCRLLLSLSGGPASGAHCGWKPLSYVRSVPKDVRLMVS